MIKAVHYVRAYFDAGTCVQVAPIANWLLVLVGEALAVMSSSLSKRLNHKRVE